MRTDNLILCKLFAVFHTISRISRKKNSRKFWTSSLFELALKDKIKKVKYLWKVVHKYVQLYVYI